MRHAFLIILLCFIANAADSMPTLEFAEDMHSQLRFAQLDAERSWSLFVPGGAASSSASATTATAASSAAASAGASASNPVGIDC